MTIIAEIGQVGFQLQSLEQADALLAIMSKAKKLTSVKDNTGKYHTAHALPVETIVSITITGDEPLTVNQAADLTKHTATLKAVS